MLFVRFTNVEDEFLKALTTPTQPSPVNDEIQPALVFSKDASDIPVAHNILSRVFQTMEIGLYSHWYSLFRPPGAVLYLPSSYSTGSQTPSR